MLTFSADHLLVSACNLTKSAFFVRALHLKSQCDFNTSLLFNIFINTLKGKAGLMNHARSMELAEEGRIWTGLSFEILLGLLKQSEFQSARSVGK